MEYSNMTAYISGPVTGTDDYMERFRDAQEHLEKHFKHVVNPTSWITGVRELNHEEYMKIDITMLKFCDVIVFLPGWQQSKGCREEYEFALRNDIVMFEMGYFEKRKAGAKYEY